MPEKIGEGLQFDVYGHGDRVEKVPKPVWRMVAHYLGWEPLDVFRPWKVRRAVGKALGRRKRLYREKDMLEGLEVLGNPEFTGRSFTQDRGTTFVELMEDSDRPRCEHLVDSYIDLVKELWRHGIHDTIWNFTINSGLDQNGSPLHMDIGELVFEKERALEEVKNRKWLDKWSYSEDMRSDLKPYFRERMSEEITFEALESRWKEKVE